MEKVYTFHTLPWLVCFAGAVYFYVRGRFRAATKDPVDPWREAALAAWALYIAAILTLTVFVVQQKIPFLEMPSFAWGRLHSGWGINLWPFHEIRIFLGMIDHWRFLVNILGNLGFFAPIACGLPLFWRCFQNLWKTLAVCLVFACGIEAAQLFVGRYVDVDDVILNTPGIFLGYAAFFLGTRWWPWLRTLARPQA